MPNQPKTVAHTVRVEADLWAAAIAAANAHDETVSDVVRRALARYVHAAEKAASAA